MPSCLDCLETRRSWVLSIISGNCEAIVRFSSRRQSRLAERAFQKIIGQGQLPDFCMESLDVHRGFGAFGRGLAFGSESAGGPFKKLRLPRCDLIGVDIELLRQLGQRLLALDRRQDRFRLEGYRVVAARCLCMDAPVRGLPRRF